jgi:hypothetical protein
MVTLRAGHDVAYFTRGSCAGGCVGAMSYYTASGEPPGQWAGRGAASLGLHGEVDPAVIERLYQKGIGPNGEMLLRPRAAKPVQDCEDAAVAAYTAEHPFASAVEIAEIRAAERAKETTSRVPYYDMPLNEVKSVSVLHASLRVAAKQARDKGDDETADELDAEADGIETDLIESARLAVEQLEAEACYTRHPDRAPFGHHGGVARRERPNRRPVPPPHQPRRRPAATRPHPDRQPRPARRPGRRHVAVPRRAAAVPDAAVDRGRRRPGDGSTPDPARLHHGAARR